MIPAWYFALEEAKFRCFDFNAKGTTIHVEGNLETSGWSVRVSVFILGHVAYGYNGLPTNSRGTWESVLLGILHQAVNLHKGDICGRKELTECMRLIWKSL